MKLDSPTRYVWKYEKDEGVIRMFVKYRAYKRLSRNKFP